MSFYKWSCEFAATLTFDPPVLWDPRLLTFYRYHNSHLRLDGLDGIDCFAVIVPLDPDPFHQDVDGQVKIHLAIPLDAGPWMDSALQIGNAFTLLQFGERIATGAITELLDPLTPIAPRAV
jgi:hypothetical protein